LIERVARARLEALSRGFPVVTVTGPRQSGKTTLCRTTFPEWPYASLESADVREFASRDPRGFLARFPKGGIIDEIQRVPDLPSYLQGLVDDDPGRRFLLTGSQNLALTQSVSQSLAGRSGLLELLPLGYDEVCRFDPHPAELLDLEWTGGYPAIHDRRVEPAEWLSAYVALYVERDVRQVVNVGDLASFHAFLRLCAGRSGRLVNQSELGSDAGVSHNTAGAWLSVLEAGYLLFRLPPFLANLRKRLVKTPKIGFYDVGLLCHLLGIEAPRQLETHPLRGPVFETWVAAECLKWARHRGRRVEVSFYRDRSGDEVDLVLRQGGRVVAIEVKSGRTIASDFFAPLRRFESALATDGTVSDVRLALVYAGDEDVRREDVEVVGWRGLSGFLDRELATPS
jgi:predicted AAA+ superfamily ATPase